MLLNGSGFTSFDLPAWRVFSIDSFAGGLVLGASSPSQGQVWRTNFAGSSPALLASVTNISEQTALSVHDGRAYWGYSIGGGGLTSVVESVRLDGSDRRVDMSVLNTIQMFQIDVVPAPGTSILFVGAGSLIMRRRQR